MLPPDFFLFLQIIIFLFITPGTPRVVIISYSINYGMKKCIWSAIGDVIANFVQATLVIFVIGSFFLDHPKVLNIFKKTNLFNDIQQQHSFAKKRITTCPRQLRLK